MSLKKIFSTKMVLLVLLLLAAVVAVPVSATDTPLFSIPGKTTVIFPSDGASTFSTVDYGPLNIPEGLLVSSTSKTLSANSDVSEPRYSLVTFTDPIPERTSQITMPVTLYGTSYNLTLNKMNFDIIDDGIDSYMGTISGFDESTVILTAGNGNLLHVSIQLPDDYISIYPVQNRQYTSQTPNPLHVVYSTHGLVYPDGNAVGFCGTEDGDSHSTTSLLSTTQGEYDWAYVNVRVVTDTRFYLDSANWYDDAAHYLANANAQFQRDDIKVVLLPTYDDSKMDLLNSHPLHLTEPLQTLAAYYPGSTLYYLRDDICLYLGGYALTGDHSNYLGVAYTNGRYAWARMLRQPWPMYYDGSDFARSYTVTHEIGHMFGTAHEKAATWIAPTLSGFQFTVMKDSYQGETRGQLNEFSSLAYHGDAWYDNAKVIRASKHTVSGHSEQIS